LYKKVTQNIWPILKILRNCIAIIAIL
jgi:hypothetical protein